MKSVRKHRGIKLFTTGRRKKYLVSEPNFYLIKFFTECLLAMQMKKTEILMNKSLSLGFSILVLSKYLFHCIHKNR